MAKSKRKPSAAQRDKNNIAIAKKLKAAGIISKQAKLHSGKYISKEVLRKVRELEPMANLNYRAVAVSKDVARAAKERGFQVVAGNKIIGPNTATFSKRLKSGQLTGVRPVRGGYMEEVILPHTVYDLRSLVEQLKSGIDTLKLPNEQFAFKYRGYESYRAFPNSKELLEYLLHYKGIERALSMKPEDLQEEFDNLSILRLHPNDAPRVIPGATERRKRSDAERRKRNRPYKSRELLSERLLARERTKDAEKKQRKRERMDEQQKAQYLEAARKRMAANRAKKKAL